MADGIDLAEVRSDAEIESEGPGLGPEQEFEPDDRNSTQLMDLKAIESAQRV